MTKYALMLKNGNNLYVETETDLVGDIDLEADEVYQLDEDMKVKTSRIDAVTVSQ